MNSPIRGFLTGFRVQVQMQGNLTGFRVQVSDTLKPHGRPFPGTPDRHPAEGSRQRRATGVLYFSSFRCEVFAG
jgi:hypothetical protein